METTKKVSPLAQRPCLPCRSGAKPIKGMELQNLLADLGGDWKALEETRLEKEYRFADFRQALAFANKVGELAENVQHHPELNVSWGKVKITLWTHKIGGLSEADLVFAAKVDALG
jgi:4a-hydroxytetrahydrobiopterin dehydratase